MQVLKKRDVNCMILMVLKIQTLLKHLRSRNLQFICCYILVVVMEKQAFCLNYVVTNKLKPSATDLNVVKINIKHLLLHTASIINW